MFSASLSIASFDKKKWAWFVTSKEYVVILTPWQYRIGKSVKQKTDKIIIKLYISENLVKKQSFWNKNEQDQTINEEVMTTKNFVEQTILILY